MNQTDIIFNETILIPDMIAQKALYDNGINESNCQDFELNVTKLCNKLDYHYVNDPKFKSKIRNPNTCREYSYMFFNHWIKGGYLKRPDHELTILHPPKQNTVSDGSERS